MKNAVNIKPIIARNVLRCVNYVPRNVKKWRPDILIVCPHGVLPKIFSILKYDYGRPCDTKQDQPSYVGVTQLFLYYRSLLAKASSGNKNRRRVFESLKASEVLCLICGNVKIFITVHVRSVFPKFQ